MIHRQEGFSEGYDRFIKLTIDNGEEFDQVINDQFHKLGVGLTTPAEAFSVLAVPKRPAFTSRLCDYQTEESKLLLLERDSRGLIRFDLNLGSISLAGILAVNKQGVIVPRHLQKQYFEGDEPIFDRLPARYFAGLVPALLASRTLDIPVV